MTYRGSTVRRIWCSIKLDGYKPPLAGPQNDVVDAVQPISCSWRLCTQAALARREKALRVQKQATAVENVCTITNRAANRRAVQIIAHFHIAFAPHKEQMPHKAPVKWHRKRQSTNLDSL